MQLQEGDAVMAGADEVYLEVRRKLREGVPPGTPFREEQFAALTGRNRSSVREALTRARAEGILVAGPGRGLVAPERSPAVRRQLWACLAGLEEVLVARLTDMDHDISAVEDPSIYKTDLDFHRALGSLGPDEPVAHLHALVLARLEQDGDTATEDVIPSSTYENTHRDLVEMIQASASEHAMRLCREHIEELADASDF